MTAFESKGYSDIFNQRGKDYHEAMMLLPNARDNEFLMIIEELKVVPGMFLVDMPSGGNYLKSYLPDSVNVIPLETSDIFARLGNIRVCSWDKLPLEDGSVDAVICCAAFHHVEQNDRVKYRQEVLRVLIPGGKLIIADVNQGSTVDTYLNGFVNEHNSMGHEGWFLNDEFGRSFENGKLQLTNDVYKRFEWQFSNDLDESMTYMKLLFGIDLASKNELADYLKDHLDLKINDAGNYKINWGLRYFSFSKIV